MPTTVLEQRVVLNDLTTLAVRDITELWRESSSLATDEFRATIRSGLAEIVDPYAATAADLSATWYEDAAPELTFQASPAALAPAEQFQSSAAWALRAAGEAALVRLAGTAQRAIFNAHRDTVVDNANTEGGARWARHASANACAFCRMLATRGAVYTSEAAAQGVTGRGKDMTLTERRLRAAGLSRGERGRYIAGGSGITRGTQTLGARYHDHCRCMAVAVRPGQSYEPPPYVEEWEQQYVDAVRNTPGTGRYDAIDTKAVLAHMEAAGKASRTSAAATRAKTPTAPAPAAKSGGDGVKPPIKPPTGGQAVSGAAGDDRSWRVPDDQVPETYPELINGGAAVHFTPKDRPDVETRRVHILDGDEDGGGHRDGAGKGKSEFAGWTDYQVMAAVDLVLADPHSVERLGSTLYFRRIVDGVPVEARVAARKPTPTLRTAYPMWDALNSIKKGKGELRWGPWTA